MNALESKQAQTAFEDLLRFMWDASKTYNAPESHFKARYSRILEHFGSVPTKDMIMALRRHERRYSSFPTVHTLAVCLGLEIEPNVDMYRMCRKSMVDGFASDKEKAYIKKYEEHYFG